MDRSTTLKPCFQAAITLLWLLADTCLAVETKVPAFDPTALLGSPRDLPPYSLQPVFVGAPVERPVAITHANDGSDRLFIVDQIGKVIALRGDTSSFDARVVLDISAQLHTEHNEEGLLGLAFHPQFPSDQRAFVYYTTPPRASVIVAFTWSDDLKAFDPNSAQEILRQPQPYGNHNSGSLCFGPDGMLYASFGDGGSLRDPDGNGQNITNLLSTVIRIDVDSNDPHQAYRIPPDNPFVDHPEARPEIWAYGVRNPWRMAFDRETGVLWLADVGEVQREEINHIERGGNYGWSIREGTLAFDAQNPQTLPDAIDPVWEYGRNHGRSITGGLVYRGTKLPALVGSYLYADYASKDIWAVRVYDPTVTGSQLAVNTPSITAFGDNEAGELFIAAFLGKNGGLFTLAPRQHTAPGEAIVFPRTLSTTGLFSNLATLVPAQGVVPYAVNVPLWSDGATTARWIAPPSDTQIQYSSRGNWSFPTGTVLIKHFQVAKHNTETQLLVNSDRGWEGYTYRWRADGSDADLLLDGAKVQITHADGSQQPWTFPSSSDCRICHTQQSGYVLGIRTAQIHHGNQLETWIARDWFANPPAQPLSKQPAFPDWQQRHDPDVNIQALARAYLDVHCSSCHRPFGTGIGLFDLRARTPLLKAKLVAHNPIMPRLLGDDSQLITPGHPQNSEIIARISHNGPRRMPPLGTHMIDADAVALIQSWIETMTPEQP